MQLVVQNILDNHERKSRSKGYTAIFTVQSIPMLIKYYELFKQAEHPFKIAGIFSYGANEESEGKDEHSRDSLERIITDYNGIYDTNFSTDTYSSYFSDVSKRLKQHRLIYCLSSICF